VPGGPPIVQTVHLLGISVVMGSAVLINLRVLGLALRSQSTEDLIRRLAQNHEVLVTVEEGSIGGFGSHVLRFLADSGLLDRGLKVRTMVLPDIFIEHGKPDAMYEQAGLTASGIVSTVLGALGRETLDDAASRA